MHVVVTSQSRTHHGTRRSRRHRRRDARTPDGFGGGARRRGTTHHRAPERHEGDLGDRRRRRGLHRCRRAQSVVILPRPDGSVPQAAITRASDHLFVVPTEAFGLLEANRLDRDLFDVTTLIEYKYDDASRATLPVIVDYGKGRTAAVESRQASLTGATPTVSVPELGMTGFHARKRGARAFWADLTTGADAAGNPTALSDGAARVDLDGRVEVALEHSVPQIHAPQAWAAGFDGAGTTVAVLDTGYDPTHPDLAGRVGTTANFTTDATVTDGHGHGTHVASTVGGTGAASDGLRKGVAPKTTLMIGKVLADTGYGEDSWVLAGMVWAVDQGADVVSMSLGGDPDDGTSPLAQAVNELSATSDSLFVVAAGNIGCRPSTVTTPGSADAALTVGAVDVNDTMAPFSSRGPRLRNGALKPEVVAPGVNITAARAAGTQLGPIVDESYTTISGTSMATPHVAGLAAMIKQEHPDWDGDQIKSVIANSAVPVAHASGFDAGTGRVDALGRDPPDGARPGDADPRVLRVAVLRPLVDPHGPDVHQHRGHRGHPVAGPGRSGRLARDDRFHVAGR